MSKQNYPDGSFYTELKEFPLKFTHNINDYNDLWELNQIIDVYKHNKIRPTVTIPNLLDAQHDKRFKSNQSFNLKLICQFLNKLECDYEIFHPHNQEVVEALLNNVTIIDNSEFILKVLNLLNANPTANNNANINNTILMSSDAGGFKPLMKLCDKIGWQGQTASASKSRLWDGKESRLVQQIQCEDFEGKDILIIDDICVYGGTFKGLANILKKRNCGKLYLAISHMTIQNLGDDSVTNYFDKVFTTNSKYNTYIAETENNTYSTKNLEIINLF